MNNRSMLNLIHRRHRPHQGFALGMSMMIGMAAVVVPAAMLMRGQEDQNPVASQRTTKIAGDYSSSSVDDDYSSSSVDDDYSSSSSYRGYSSSSISSSY